MSAYRLLPTSLLICLVAGCATSDGGTAGSGAAPQSAAPAESAAGSSAPASPGEFQLAGSINQSGTSVGARAAALGREVDTLDSHAGSCGTNQAEIKAQRAQLSNDYFMRVAQINSRLEAGTTAGNPELVTQWQSARSALDSLDREAARLGDLVTSCTDDTAQAAYLGQSIRATMNLRGAVDADRAELVKQSGRVASISSSLELNLGLMLDDLNRQNEMLLVEHRNLSTLAHAIDVGQLLGGNLGLRGTPMPGWTAAAPAPRQHAPISLTPLAPHHMHHSVAPAAPAAAPAVPADGTAPVPATTPPASPADGTAPAKPHKHHHHTAWTGEAPLQPVHFHRNRPLITIPLGSDGGYEHSLYGAVGTVLNKQPEARFVVEAAVPRNPNRSRAVLDATDAQRQADGVARALAAFGLGQSRIVTTSTYANAAGIRVYAQ